MHDTDRIRKAVFNQRSTDILLFMALFTCRSRHHSFEAHRVLCFKLYVNMTLFESRKRQNAVNPYSSLSSNSRMALHPCCSLVFDPLAFLSVLFMIGLGTFGLGRFIDRNTAAIGGGGGDNTKRRGFRHHRDSKIWDFLCLGEFVLLLLSA